MDEVAGVITSEGARVYEQGASADRDEEQQTPILDLLLLLAARGRFLVLVTVAVMLLALGVTFAMTKTYTATASIMPPQSPQSSLSAMLGQLGSLAGLGGNPLKNPADLYIGILQSRNITDRVITHFDLKSRWHTKNMTGARGALGANAQFESSKDGMIQIAVKATEPQLASDIANFYIDSLYEVNASLAITEAAQRRLFYEHQLGEEKTVLASAEDDLKKIQQRTGLLTITGQTELAVRNVAQTRAQISSLEVQLQGLRTYASEDNPDVARIEQEIRTLRGQLATQESSERSATVGDPEVATGRVPGEGLEYARKLREVKYHETLYDLLSRQYEAARIDEAKSAPTIQVIDRAEPPDLPSGPRRKLIVLGSGLVSFLLACAWVLFRGAMAKRRQQPETAKKLRQLQSYLPWFPL